MNLPEPSSALQKANVFSAFVEQLRKDFQGAGIALEDNLSIPSDFNALKEVLKQFLFSSGSRNNAALPQLLYRVDISEAQIKKYGNINKEQSFEDLIAELIIKRVLQKVVIRKTHSGEL